MCTPMKTGNLEGHEYIILFLLDRKKGDMLLYEKYLLGNF